MSVETHVMFEISLIIQANVPLLQWLKSFWYDKSNSDSSQTGCWFGVFLATNMSEIKIALKEQLPFTSSTQRGCA